MEHRLHARAVLGLPLLAVSGEEITFALERAGFHRITRAVDATVLTRGFRDVVVPTGPVGAEGLREILRAAGLSYAAFLDDLEQHEERVSRVLPILTDER